MTVTVTGVVKNVAGMPDRSKWVFTSLLRESGDSDNSIVSTNLVVATPNTAGLLTVELDPGPVIVRYRNTAVTVTVPDVDELDLWEDLLAVAVNIPPGTPDQKLAQAVESYLEAHPPAGGGDGANLAVTLSATQTVVTSDTGTDATIPAVDATNAGVMTPTQKAKLDGVATGATANDTDANLKDRANHTGTQSSSTIDDLTEAVQDIIGTFIGGTSGVTVTYDDSGNTFTITGPGVGGGGGLDAEGVRDAIGVALVGTGLISVTVNDAGDTITVSTTATANDTDANLKNRANHTGTQSADTVVDGTTNHVFTAADDTKLAGIASGATVNDTDANLKARANHTGTQSADTVTDGTTNKAYTATEKTKLAGIAAGAEVNVNADWTSVSGDSQILNKPTTFPPTIGATSTTAVAGNDSRLTDTRTPTDNTVTSAKIVDGSIVDADINASAAIAKTKLSSAVQTSLGLADTALQSEQVIIGTLPGSGTTGKLYVVP